MAIMGRYCKAYPYAAFEQFSEWSRIAASATSPEQTEYLFVQEDLSVTKGVLMDEEVVLDRITPEWETFCRDVLRFSVPDNLVKD